MEARSCRPPGQAAASPQGFIHLLHAVPSADEVAREYSHHVGWLQFKFLSLDGKAAIAIGYGHCLAALPSPPFSLLCSDTGIVPFPRSSPCSPSQLCCRLSRMLGWENRSQQMGTPSSRHHLMYTPSYIYFCNRPLFLLLQRSECLCSFQRLIPQLVVWILFLLA